MPGQKVIRISEKNYNTIIKGAGKHQQKTGKPQSINSFITILLEKWKKGC